MPLFAVRDPHGLRPLCLGWRDKHWIVASESCALDTVGAEWCETSSRVRFLRLDGAGLECRLNGESAAARGSVSLNRSTLPAPIACSMDKQPLRRGWPWVASWHGSIPRKPIS